MSQKHPLDIIYFCILFYYEKNSGYSYITEVAA